MTGRIGTGQHLPRAIRPILDAGGVRLADGTRIPIDPVLVGRDEAKLARVAGEHGIKRFTTDLDVALGDSRNG